MASIRIRIVIDDAHIDQCDAMARALGGLGVTIEDQIPLAGVMFGSVEADRLETVRGLVGVADVGPEDTVHLPPISDRTPQ